MTLDGALARRRSIRSFASRALTPNEIGRLVWAAQGITDRSTGGRTAPSAGALYPLEVYAVLPGGVFRYAPEAHALERVSSGDRRGALARAAHGQDAVRLAPIDIVLAGVPARTARKYGARAERYMLLEAGHAAQNVLLEAVGLGLGAVPVGAFDDAEAARVVGLSQGESAVCILPVGVPVR
jgi:SagB-type dehydrogenase family enzyme